MITVISASVTTNRVEVKFSHDQHIGAHVYGSPIDAMLAYTSLVALGRFTRPSVMAEHLNINPTSLSHTRAGRQSLPDKWLLWAHEFSGAPVSSLRLITGSKRP